MKFTIKPLRLEDVWVYDIEVFQNLFLFKAHRDGEWKSFASADGNTDFEKLAEWLPGKILCGFNNDAYDDVILKYVCANLDDVQPIDLYNLSGSIINGLNQDVVRHYMYAEKPWKMSIDVFQLKNGRGSLKEWMAKMGMPKVMESPHAWDKPLPKECWELNAEYCKNDVIGTYELLKRNWHLVDLRTSLKRKYNLGDRVYVLSEAKIAQHTFMTLHEEKTGVSIQTVRKLARKNADNRTRTLLPQEIVFDHVKFETAEFKSVHDRFMKTKFLGNANGGFWKIESPEFNRQIQIGSRKYKLGVGGIHSVDKPGRWESDVENVVIDLDVTSYYPAIIINNELNPAQLGKGFVDDMIMLRDQRVEAKKSGDKKTADALKIVINSTFGKLNDVYSPLRSIPDALRVTINGQWMMLMFIESIEPFAKIISANTDGVAIFISRRNIPKLNACVEKWQKKTKHELELTEYSRFWQRDVNNYIAIGVDSKVKGKGEFAIDDSKGKGDGLIITEAAIAHISRGEKIGEFIRSCSDITKFLYYQRVKNGGDIWIEKNGEKKRIGLMARWFISKSKEAGSIFRRNPGNREAKKAQAEFVRLPCGDPAYTAMDLTKLPNDAVQKLVDFEHYISEAVALVESTKSKKGT